MSLCSGSLVGFFKNPLEDIKSFTLDLQKALKVLFQ